MTVAISFSYVLHLIPTALQAPRVSPSPSTQDTVALTTCDQLRVFWSASSSGRRAHGLCSGALGRCADVVATWGESRLVE